MTVPTFSPGISALGSSPAHRPHGASRKRISSKRTSIFVNSLKLRASWAQMGNDQVYYMKNNTPTLFEYQYINTYSFGSYVINGNAATTLGETVVPNPHFTWEVCQ